MNFAKFLKAPFLQNTSRRLLLVVPILNECHVKESLAFAEQIEEQESEFFRESIDVGSLFTSIHLKTTLKFAVTHPWKILKK